MEPVAVISDGFHPCSCVLYGCGFLRCAGGHDHVARALEQGFVRDLEVRLDDCGLLLPRLPDHGRQLVEEFLFGNRVLPTRLLETILHRATLLKGNNLPASG